MKLLIWGLLLLSVNAAATDVVVITLDTTRADALSCYGSNGVRTPALDRIASQSTLFERAYSPAPLTLPAHCSMFTGLYPFHAGVRDNHIQALPASRTALAELLRAKGFATAAVVASVVLDRRFGLAQGFDAYDDAINPATGVLSADQVTDKALIKLKSLASPFFLWVHYYDPHYPYAPPSSVNASSPYLGEVAFMDSQIKRLLTGLDLSRTLLIVAGDHGESLDEHNEMEHGCLLYESAMRVPLMVHLPGQQGPRRTADPVSTVAITPTVLEALNMTGDFKGDEPSLLHPKKEAFVYLETLSPFLTYQWSPLSGLVYGTMKYIRSSSSEELYDLSKDPAEADDLSARRPPILLKLRNELDRLCPAGPAAVTDVEAPELPSELQASLRSLGYLGATGALPKNPSAKGLPNPRDLADIPGFVNHKGQQLIRAGQLREFFNLAKGILRRDPSNISVINLVGSAYREEKNYARSEEILLQGLNLAPNDYYLLANLGKTEALLKKYPESEAHLKKAMEINPFLLDAYVDLTRTFQEQGKSPQASAVIEMAFENRIRHPLLLSTMALLAIDRKDCAAAIPYLKEALANDPALLEAIGNLTFCYHQTGNLDAAWETVQKGLALAPKDFQMLQTAFGIAYSQRRMDKAKEIAVTFVDLYGVTEEARRMRQIFPEIGP